MQLPPVPPIPADTLPAEGVLLRGSEEPTREQSQVLLRGAAGSSVTLKVSGTFTGGKFSGSLKVTLP